MMRFTTLLAIVFLSCSPKEKKQDTTLNLSQPNTKIDNFWKWFVENKSIYEAMTDDDRDEKLELVLEQLSKVENGLAVEMSKEVNGIRDIVISADGDRNKFDIVKEIVAKAPHIDKWTVTAFRQRAPEGFSLVYEDIKFVPSKMYFDPIIDGDSLDVVVYVDNLSKYDYNQVAYYGLITIDNVLGEYDCVMKVRHYEFRDTNEIGNKDEFKRLSELPKYVDDFHNARIKN